MLLEGICKAQFKQFDEWLGKKGIFLGNFRYSLTLKSEEFTTAWRLIGDSFAVLCISFSPASLPERKRPHVSNKCLSLTIHPVIVLSPG